MSNLYVKMVVMIFGPRFQWLPIGCRWSLGHQECQKTTLGFFITGVSTQSVRVIARFSWKFLSVASYFVVLVVLLTMSSKSDPKCFPWLRKSGNYFLKGVLVNRWGSLHVSLRNSSQRPATLGFPWHSSQ